MLRIVRILTALVLLSLITFCFVDFAGIAGNGVFIPRVQLIPALLSGSFAVLLILLLLTFVLGRVYCSVLCPLGVFQDVAAWIARKLNPKRHYAFRKESRWVRYGVAGGVVLIFALGGTVALSLLDPYSLFGRMAVNVFRPVYMGGNNLLAAIFNAMDNYTFYHMDVFVLSLFSLIVGLLTFSIITFLAWRYGRLYCNTVCPVGTVLGLLSRHSLLRVRIDAGACVKCGKCERLCKSSCIDSQAKLVDASRCVACFRCVGSCRSNALSYGLVRREKKAVVRQPDDSRRGFMTAVALAALSVPTASLAKGVAVVTGNHVWKREHPLTPPGSVSAHHLLRHCTACHLCVSRCPSKVLKPAFMEYGLGGMMQPRMDFEHGFCNFDCTVCADVCPNGALLKLTKEEKHKLQVGRVVFVEENCIVRTDGTSCGACSEHCPTQAVSMQPYRDGLTIPVVNPDICVGCGGCEYVCPVRPFRAIYVEGNPEHRDAATFRETEKKELQLDSFGF